MALRKVKSLNMRRPSQLEMIAQSMEDLEDLMKLKAIVINAQVFDEKLEGHVQKGKHMKKMTAVNDEVRQSLRLKPGETPVLDQAEEDAAKDMKQKMKQGRKRSNSNEESASKKSSFKEVDEAQREKAQPPAKPKRKPKRQEEWEDIDEASRKEFWSECQEINGDFHFGIAIKGQRENMEDTFDSKSSVKAGCPNLFAVYDGHGGDSCAKYCQTFLLQQLAKRTDISTDTKSSLINQFMSIDADYARDYKDKPTEQAGCTATVIAVVPINVNKSKKKSRRMPPTGAQETTFSPQFGKSMKGKKKPETVDGRMNRKIMDSASENHNKHEFKFFCASAGDSRAVLVYASGKTVPLSLDHNLRRRDELQRIKDEEGEIRYDPEFNELLVYSEEAQRGLNVTRSIGDPDFKPMVTALPDIKQGFLTADAAFFVIASDGLWGSVQTEEVGRIVTEYGLEQGLKNLADLANMRGNTDNITLMGVDAQQMVREMKKSL